MGRTILKTEEEVVELTKKGDARMEELRRKTIEKLAKEKYSELIANIKTDAAEEGARSCKCWVSEGGSCEEFDFLVCDLVVARLKKDGFNVERSVAISRTEGPSGRPETEAIMVVTATW